METVILRENHVKGLFLAHAQSLELVNLTSLLTYQNNPHIRGNVMTILIPQLIWHWKYEIIEFHIRNASNNISHLINQKQSDIFQMRLLVTKKWKHGKKEGLFWLSVILVEGYSDYYCRWLFYSDASFGFIFTVLWIQLSSLLPPTQIYIGPAGFNLAFWM